MVAGGIPLERLDLLAHAVGLTLQGGIEAALVLLLGLRFHRPAAARTQRECRHLPAPGRHRCVGLASPQRRRGAGLCLFLCSGSVTTAGESWDCGARRVR